MSKAQTKQINQEVLDLHPAYETIQAKLGAIAPVASLHLDLSFTFSAIFSQLFLCDTPSYELSKGNFGATRSNWTYHTAIAISQTCKFLNLCCKFEANGRRDAVIQARDDSQTDILFAEWEWDYLDVFGKGKELEKLKDSCKESKTGEALLLTYCPETDFVDYLQRIADYWISSVKKIKNPPALFLHTVIFEEASYCRNFDRLRTVEIAPEGISVWNDKLF